MEPQETNNDWVVTECQQNWQFAGKNLIWRPREGKGSSFGLYHGVRPQRYQRSQFAPDGLGFGFQTAPAGRSGCCASGVAVPPASHQPLLQNHLLYASEFQSWFDRLACPEYNRVGVRFASRAPCQTRIPLGVTASRLGSTASNFQNRCLVDKATQCCLEETKKKKKIRKKKVRKKKKGNGMPSFLQPGPGCLPPPLLRMPGR